MWVGHNVVKGVVYFTVMVNSFETIESEIKVLFYNFTLTSQHNYFLSSKNIVTIYFVLFNFN